ncbi:MAG: LysM peptidoglycan-binding domain-containing protein [Desulfocurvibacter africanus]
MNPVVGNAIKDALTATALGKLFDEAYDAGGEPVTWIWDRITQKDDLSKDDLTRLSTEEILGALPDKARQELARKIEESKHPHEVRRPVSDSRLAYTSALGSKGHARLDNGLRVDFSHGRPDTHGQYTVETDDSVASIAERFGLNPEVLGFSNQGLSDERLRPGQTLRIPLSGNDLHQMREILDSSMGH